jgi:branched-chain amino acid transport system ATP-binding protein
MTGNPILELFDVHTYYGESHVLHGLSLKVDEGSVAVILGRNGMGKTTTVHSIIGFTPPRSGRITFRGEEITSLAPHKIPQLGLALVPQGRRIFPSLSVKENLTTAARGRGKRDVWSLERVYTLFPILAERAGLKGNLLSGGEQQMLCIGRALMTNPDLLLMDEPSEGLAPLIVQELGRVIRQLHQGGLSILLVEQNLQLAMTVAEYVYVINIGLVVYESTPEQLLHNEEIKTKYLGVAGGENDHQKEAVSSDTP